MILSLGTQRQKRGIVAITFVASVIAIVLGMSYYHNDARIAMAAGISALMGSPLIPPLWADFVNGEFDFK